MYASKAHAFTNLAKDASSPASNLAANAARQTNTNQNLNYYHIFG